MNRAIFSFLLISSLMSLSFSTFAQLKLQASVDRNPVMINESFILEITANESVDVSDLDLSPLARTGLIQGRTATSSQTQIINGDIAKTTRWSIVLLARNAGDYQIPALSLNNVRSNPITVKVVPGNPNKGKSGNEIFVKSRVEHDSLYLQQSTKLITRLYFSSQVDLQGGTLLDPSLDGATIKQQGKDREDSEIIMGVRYRVIERTYTLTPQSSGQFTITSPTFNGEISVNRRRSSFSAFSNSKPVSAIGNDVSINVLPIPNGYQGAWLPSDMVQLAEEWQPNTVEFTVGEPITRTLTLTALNVNPEQLPELTGSYPSSFKVYPDQGETHAVARQNAIVAQRVQSEAIVATEVGEFTLPEMTVSWFNTKTKQQQNAVLPSRTIKVVAAAESEQPILPALTSPQTQADCPVTASTPSNTLWSWFSYLGWLLWLLTMVLWWKKSNKAPKHTESQPQAYSLSALKAACKQNNYQQVRVELLKWAQSMWPEKNIRHLNQLNGLVSDELWQAMNEVQQAMYSTKATSWDGNQFYNVFKNQKVSPAKSEKTLAKLN